MRPGDHLHYLLGDVRIPLHEPEAPTDWKEWYHFVLFDPQGGVRILANCSLSGVPGNGQVTFSTLATVAEADHRYETYGFVRDAEWEIGSVGRAPFRAESGGFACVVDGPNSWFNGRDSRSGVALALRGRALVDPLVIPEYLPFGSGFVGWGLVPGVRPDGELRIGDQSFSIGSDWFCYHDHNYGRFRWGDDVGWIWFVISARLPGGEDLVLVMHRGNSRQASRIGTPYLFVYAGGALRKSFVGATLDIVWTWTDVPVRPPRMPGSMASLFAAHPTRVPTGLKIDAADEKDRLALRMSVDSLMEYILPDNVHRQYSFIEEMNGRAAIACRIGTLEGETEGPFYAEFVH